MSRAYKIKVSETLSKLIKVDDGVCTTLDLLPIVEPELMDGILAKELEAEGFVRNEDNANELVQERGDIVVIVNVKTHEAHVTAKAEQQVDLEGSKEARVWEEQIADGIENDIKQEICKQLENEAEGLTSELQRELTETLEKELADIQVTLNKVTNRTVADALKVKASRLGTIKSMDEDRENGTLSITIEV